MAISSPTVIPSLVVTTLVITVFPSDVPSSTAAPSSTHSARTSPSARPTTISTHYSKTSISTRPTSVSTSKHVATATSTGVSASKQASPVEHSYNSSGGPLVTSFLVVFAVFFVLFGTVAIRSGYILARENDPDFPQERKARGYKPPFPSRPAKNSARYKRELVKFYIANVIEWPGIQLYHFVKLLKKSKVGSSFHDGWYKTRATVRSHINSRFPTSAAQRLGSVDTRPVYGDRRRDPHRPATSLSGVTVWPGDPTAFRSRQRSLPNNGFQNVPLYVSQGEQIPLQDFSSSRPRPGTITDPGRDSFIGQGEFTLPPMRPASSVYFWSDNDEPGHLPAPARSRGETLSYLETMRISVMNNPRSLSAFDDNELWDLQRDLMQKMVDDAKRSGPSRMTQNDSNRLAEVNMELDRRQNAENDEHQEPSDDESIDDTLHPSDSVSVARWPPVHNRAVPRPTSLRTEESQFVIGE
ncbi:hypothetical protein NA57DRAFT_57029 [Rhizodiscina lignyota]|uniref:Uncharacterized protein n=1 Tax=Rhizodiscina lignyota TaxID=1504668 RepID=A0A9P4I9S7_9PEZI|nr:hypothetical protein NA57DRAFT_57029 [Rhizodiscina lignyota]